MPYQAAMILTRALEKWGGGGGVVVVVVGGGLTLCMTTLCCLYIPSAPSVTVRPALVFIKMT